VSPSASSLRLFWMRRAGSGSSIDHILIVDQCRRCTRHLRLVPHQTRAWSICPLALGLAVMLERSSPALWRPHLGNI